MGGTVNVEVVWVVYTSCFTMLEPFPQFKKCNIVSTCNGVAEGGESGT